MNSHPKRPRDPNQLAGPTNRVAGVTSTLERKLKFRIANSSGTNRIRPATASLSQRFCYVQPGGV